MIQNFKHCTSYIFIDAEYLISKLHECYEFYSNEYPGRKFQTFELQNLLAYILRATNINHKGDSINVVLLYKLKNSIIPYTDGPEDLFLFSNYETPLTLTTNEGAEVHLYSIFANPESNDQFEYDEEYINYLREIAYSDDAFTIVLCKDGQNCGMINYWLETFEKEVDKKFYIYRNYEYNIGIDEDSSKFSYINIDYTIASCFGLKKWEW